MASITYDDRILSWFDIVDFSGFVAQQGSNANAVRRVYRLFEEARDIFKKTHLTIMEVDFEQWNYHIVSDTMAVSCPYRSHDELNILNFQTTYFQMGMIVEYGLFVRGAMVFGKVYDKEADKIFGPAVIRAHNLESCTANWFRILVAQSVIDVSETMDYIDLYKRDGRYHFLNYLNEMFHMSAQICKPQSLFKSVKHPLDIFRIHKHRIESSAGSVPTSKKRASLKRYSSLADYHNEVIDIHCRLIERILGSKQELRQIVHLATPPIDPTSIPHSTLWGLVSLLRNDLGIAGLSSDVHNRTSAYLQQLKKDLSTCVIDTTRFHI